MAGSDYSIADAYRMYPGKRPKEPESAAKPVAPSPVPVSTTRSAGVEAWVYCGGPVFGYAYGNSDGLWDYFKPRHDPTIMPPMEGGTEAQLLRGEWDNGVTS